MGYADVERKRMKTTAREIVTDLLENIDDPLDRPTGDVLYSKRRPRTKSQEFEGYPYIHVDGINIQNIGATDGGTLVEYTVDVEFHVWGREDTDDQVAAHDSIVDQVIEILTGPEKAVLARESGMTEPNIIRNVDFTGVRQKDQPVQRQEVEFRTDVHKDMSNEQ